MKEILDMTSLTNNETENITEHSLHKEIYPEVAEIIKESPQLQEAIELYKEKCDEYTIEHVFGDANKSALLADYLDLDEEHKKFFIQAALLHDIGKTDDEIGAVVKSKNDHLSPKEIAIIHDHVRQSIEYAKEIGMSDEVLQIIGAHHEENNGNSYPRNKENRNSDNDFVGEEKRTADRRKEPSEQIKKIIHAFAIIDQFDALFYKRSYKDEKSLEEGCNILRGNFTNTEDRKMIDLLLEERQKELYFQGKMEEKE